MVGIRRFIFSLSLSLTSSLFRARAGHSTALTFICISAAAVISMFRKLPSLLAYEFRFLILILLLFLLLFRIRESFSFRQLILTIVCFETRMARWMTNESLRMPFSIVVFLFCFYWLLLLFVLCAVVDVLVFLPAFVCLFVFLPVGLFCFPLIINREQLWKLLQSD